LVRNIQFKRIGIIWELFFIDGIRSIPHNWKDINDHWVGQVDVALFATDYRDARANNWTNKKSETPQLEMQN
jgi:hypothetical protein